LALNEAEESFLLPSAPFTALPRAVIICRQGAKLVESVADIEEELTAWWSADSITDTVRAAEIVKAKRNHIHPVSLLTEPACRIILTKIVKSPV
jgi:hypothetical protein